MNETSKEIIHFVDTVLYSKIKDFPKTKFSIHSKEILYDLFQKMIHANNMWGNISSTIQQQAVHFQVGEPFPKSSDFLFYPAEIRNEIESSLKAGYIYSFTINGRQFEIVLLDVSCEAITPKVFAIAIQKIYIWLYVAGLYADSKCSQKMNIYIYWTKHNKILPHVGEPIDKIHVNTAFTTSCKKVTELNLYRYEEWFKVLIHETFHNMGLDFSAYSQSDVNEYILKLFPIKSEVNLFETYTETWAEIINVCFLVFFTTRRGSSVENLIRKTEKFIDNERIFSLFQCAKVLHFYGLDYDDLYAKTNAAQLLRKYKYKESTNILAYYILKSLMMFFIDDFLIWCRGGGEAAATINFPKTNVHENMLSFCHFIKEHYLRHEYKHMLHKIQTFFPLYQKRFDSRFKISEELSLEKIRKTMRMTVFG